MASGVTDTNIADWLERNYTPAKLGNVALKDAPLTAWLSHDEKAGGEVIVMRWKYGHSQGVGQNYSQAKTRADASGLKPFKVHMDYETFYTVATVDNTAIERSIGGNLSAENVLTESINGAMEVHGDHLETFLFSDGYPSLGTIADISGATFTVAQADIEKWETDLEIVFAQNRATGVLRNAGGSLVVSKVDRTPNSGAAGNRCLITMSANIATLAAVANGDSTFIKSTRQDAASPAMQAICGIMGYIPPTVSLTDAFGDTSANRSVEPFRLAGPRIPIAAGTTVEQGLVDFFVQCSKYKVKPDALWVNFERWGDLIKEQMGKTRYVNFRNEKYGVNISGIMIDTPKGQVPVMASAKCPYEYTWALKRDSWSLKSVNGALIRPATRYQKFLDQASADAIELRYRSFAQLACLRPWDNAIGVFA